MVRRAKSTCVDGDSPQRDKHERGRRLVAKDRRLFFSIVSLLMDPAKLPPSGDVPTQPNDIKEFIPKEFHYVVDELCTTLLWDC
jgi:hypothetical protein